MINQHIWHYFPVQALYPWPSGDQFVASYMCVLDITWCIMPSQKFATMLLNTLRPKQNVRHFAEAIFKCIFLNEKAEISIKIALQFVPKDSINNISALFQIMPWHWLVNKPLSETMIHICITWPHWVKQQMKAPQDSKKLVNRKDQVCVYGKWE